MSTTAREDRSLKRAFLADRKKSFSDLAAELREGANKNISARTVRRRLLEVGLKGCKARKKPYLSQANKNEKTTGICKKTWKLDTWCMGQNCWGKLTASIS